MRAPHPSLRQLYRLAAAPSQIVARLQRTDALLARLDVELIPGGAGGDELLVRLIRGLELGELLDGTLARLEAPRAPRAAESGRRDIADTPRARSEAAAASAAGVPRRTAGSGRPYTEQETESVRSHTRRVVAHQVARSVAAAASAADPPRQMPESVRADTRHSPLAVRRFAPAVSRRATAERPTANGQRRTTLACAWRPDAAGPAAGTTALHTIVHATFIARAVRRGVADALHERVARGVSERVDVILRQSKIEKPAAPPPPETTPNQRLAATVARVERAKRHPDVASAPAPRTSGLRGLAARAESRRAPVPPEHKPPVRAHQRNDEDGADLAARVYDLLRRDAERHGIDVTGVEP